MTRVGIIGVGRMGSQIWRRLQEQGLSAAVTDVDRRSVDALRDEGADVASDTAALAAGCEVLLLSLPTSTEVEEVALGASGLASTAAPGTLVVDLTSGVPSSSRRIAEQLARSQIRYVDVGVSGGVGGARAGTLKAMAGGDARDVGDASAVLDLITSKLWHCGPVGSGHLVKTLLNQSNQAKLMIELEALLVAARAGLDVEQVADVLELPVWSHWLFGPEGRQPVGFALALACKDFDIALRVAAEERVAVPLAATAQHVLRLAWGAAGPDADLIDTVRVWEGIAGTRIAPREEGSTG
jgi:3-hydroxyisobutyrate dehydrogenase-like beta-hydroxyacid dehydrogenase